MSKISSTIKKKQGALIKDAVSLVKAYPKMHVTVDCTMIMS